MNNETVYYSVCQPWGDPPFIVDFTAETACEYEDLQSPWLTTLYDAWKSLICCKIDLGLELNREDLQFIRKEFTDGNS